MTIEWKKYNASFVSNRYNYIAPIYPFFEWIFLLPKSIRRKTIHALSLNKGDTVLEIGCGTGKNLKLLSEAVGKEGTVYGIDVSGGMIKRAKALEEEMNLSNVKLLQTDAIKYIPEKKINGVLFSLSYATMIERKDVLRNIWSELETGGKAVIMDAQFPPGIAGKMMAPIKPFVTLFLKASVLGNPYIKPVEELREISEVEVDVLEVSMKSYFIATAVKP